MPTYDYLCRACDHRFEEFQSMTAKVLRKCPKCRKNQLERLIGTGAGVIFKGSGFYETDYRGESYASAAKKDADGGSSDGGSSDGGGDGAAKPATESAQKPASAPKSTSKKSDSTD